MKNKLNYLSFGLCLIIIALTIFQPLAMLAPGRVSDGHLNISSDCFKCHSSFTGINPSDCLNCHKPEDIGKSIKSIPQFHAELTTQDCMHCHSEHKGVFEAGVKPRFEHGFLKSEIRDKCAGCHKPPADMLHKSIGTDCKLCHKTKGWKPADFKHDKNFRFDDAHPSDCITCHTNDDFKSYTCYSCHEHSPDRIKRKHREEGIMNTDKCADCHKGASENDFTGHEKEGERDRESDED